MTETGQTTTTTAFPAELRNAVRAAVIAYSIVGLIVGIIMLFRPTAALWIIAVLFGISLIVGGIVRLATAFAAQQLSTSWRVLMGIMGVIILAVGVVCLFHPGSSLWLLTILIGIGWIFQGVHDLVTYSGKAGQSGWIVAGAILSIIAGIIVCALPGLAIGTFIWVGGILLIIVSIASLFTLPKKA